MTEHSICTILDSTRTALAGSVKTALLVYFGHDGYKLLDKSTSAIFKSRDVIFKERITYLAK